MLPLPQISTVKCHRPGDWVQDEVGWATCSCQVCQSLTPSRTSLSGGWEGIRGGWTVGLCSHGSLKAVCCARQQQSPFKPSHTIYTICWECTCFTFFAWWVTSHASLHSAGPWASYPIQLIDHKSFLHLQRKKMFVLILIQEKLWFVHAFDAVFFPMVHF